MAGKHSGSEYNEGIIKKLIEKSDSIIEEGRKNESAPDKSGLETITITKEDGSTETIYVTAKDKQTYEKINYVKEILDFGEFELSQVYDLSGGTINLGSGATSFRFYLPVVDAPSYVERIINSRITEVLDIKFPQEFYMLSPKIKDRPLKFQKFEMDAPRPRKGDESIEQYEQYLEEEYKKHGVEKTQDAGTAWRMPYPHEKVDFKNELSNREKSGKAEETKEEDTNQSSYYPIYVEHQKKVDGKHTRITPGRHKATGSRVSTIRGTAKNFIQNLLRARIVNLGISKYFVAGAAGVGVSVLLFGPAISTAFISAAIAVGATKAFDMIKYATPYKRKPKNNGNPGTTDTDEPTEEIDLDIDLDELEAIRREIEDNLAQIKEKAARYDTLRQEMEELNKNPEENTVAIDQHKAEMAQLVIELKELAANNDEILNAYMDKVNKKGRSL